MTKIKPILLIKTSKRSKNIYLKISAWKGVLINKKKTILTHRQQLSIPLKHDKGTSPAPLWAHVDKTVIICHIRALIPELIQPIGLEIDRRFICPVTRKLSANQIKVNPLTMLSSKGVYAKAINTCSYCFTHDN